MSELEYKSPEFMRVVPVEARSLPEMGLHEHFLVQLEGEQVFRVLDEFGGHVFRLTYPEYENGEDTTSFSNKDELPQRILGRVGFIFRLRDVLAPLPDRLVPASNKQGLDVKLVPNVDDAISYEISANDYVEAYSVRQHPVGTYDKYMYLHDIEDDHLLPLVVCGDWLMDTISRIAADSFETSTQSFAGKIIDQLTSVTGLLCERAVNGYEEWFLRSIDITSVQYSVPTTEFSESIISGLEQFGFDMSLFRVKLLRSKKLGEIATA